MRKFLSLLALLIWAIQSTAQTEKTGEQIKKELSEHPQQDTFRVNRLIESLFGSDIPREERKIIAAEALTISRKIGYLQGECAALANLGYLQVLLGNEKEGDSLLRYAESIAKKSKNQKLIGLVAFELGLILSSNGDSKCLDYLTEAERAFDKAGSYWLLAHCQNSIANFYTNNLSNYPPAMDYYLKAIHSAEKANSRSRLINSWTGLGGLYALLGDHENALVWLKKAEAEMNKGNSKNNTYLILQNELGEAYRLSGKYREAIAAYKRSIKTSNPINVAINESNLADTYLRMDSLSLCFQYALSSLPQIQQSGDNVSLGWVYGILSRAYLKKAMPDSSIWYASTGLDSSVQSGSIEYMRDNAEALANAYAFKKDFAKAYKYHLQFINYRDSMLNTELKNKTALLQYNNNLGKKELQITQLNQQKKTQKNFQISLFVVLGLIVISAIAMLRSIRQKQKANKLLQSQKKEIEVQRDQTDMALANLKQTQVQLIQSEKMASLGELTAGIAHEIQNPLNFVNNFSELNAELLDELSQEVDNGNFEEVKTLAKDIKENEQKINHHGKRADAIVKGMLQHSRSSSAVKEPTDINALCDEYLRLSYHGLRAKDKSFNATLNTDFDKSIGNINIIPQDIGRVILNLLTNAFYATEEKKKSGVENFEPSVFISTKKIGDKVEIKVTDNGKGIPKTVLDKIFQPFFTTKPTGQGTGLGLSLSYDIVTKGHGGELKVETNESEGTSFIVSLSA